MILLRGHDHCVHKGHHSCLLTLHPDGRDLTLAFQLLTSRIAACPSCEGGEIVHLGEIFKGDIKQNSIVFTQRSNHPAIPKSGAGIMVQETRDYRSGLPRHAEQRLPARDRANVGGVGGIRLQQVNGTETGTLASQPHEWQQVAVTNNIAAIPKFDEAQRISFGWLYTQTNFVSDSARRTRKCFERL